MSILISIASFASTINDPFAPIKVIKPYISNKKLNKSKSDILIANIDGRNFIIIGKKHYYKGDFIPGVGKVIDIGHGFYKFLNAHNKVEIFNMYSPNR